MYSGAVILLCTWIRQVAQSKVVKLPQYDPNPTA